MDRIEELKAALYNIDQMIANKQSHFLDDAGLTKMQQERNFVNRQLKELTSETNI
jgi:hypothetical protein